MTNLILAWSSTEYIGGGNFLQFTSNRMLGSTESSMNVVATLTNNTNVGGVPVLVSELRIVADQASVVMCSGTNGVTVSMEFSISGIYIWKFSLLNNFRQ